MLVDEAETRYKHFSKEEKTLKSSRSVGGRVGVDSDFAGKLELGKSRSSYEVYESNTRNFRCYRHIALDCLSADNVERAGPVSGPVISNYVGWRVVPLTSDQPSGALARLRVARPWISLTQPSIVSKNGPVTDRLRRLLGSSESDFKREAFTTLLEKLVHLRLQEPDEQKFATLAASCVAVKPKVLRETITSEPIPEPLELDLTSVVNFLDASSPEEIHVLLEDQVQNEDEPTLDPYDPEIGSNGFDEEGIGPTSLTENETDTRYEVLSVNFVGDMAWEVSRVLGFGRIESQTLISNLIIYGEKRFDGRIPIRPSSKRDTAKKKNHRVSVSVVMNPEIVAAIAPYVERYSLPKSVVLRECIFLGVNSEEFLYGRMPWLPARLRAAVEHHSKKPMPTSSRRTLKSPKKMK